MGSYAMPPLPASPQRLQVFQARNPTTKAVLVAVLSDPEILAKIDAFCRRTWKGYPEGGEAVFLWRTFWAAGIDVPYVETIERFDHLAKRQGWEVRAAHEQPEAGDLAIYRTVGGLGAEFVAKPVMGSADYYGVGAGQERGRRVAVNGHAQSPSGPVLYWLRRRCTSCEKRREQANAERA